MRAKILLFTSVLSWAIYDTNLFRRRSDPIANPAIEVSLDELSGEHEQQKKIQRHKANVIPQWHRDQRKPVASRCNYFSTKPRDVRFSNQRKIRRMFNNI